MNVFVKKFPAARALQQAGFQHLLLHAVSETLLKQLSKEPSVNVVGTPQKRCLFAVVPYVHKVSHNLRKVAGKYGVDLVFAASCKLAQLCKRITGSQERICCTSKHLHKCDPRATVVMFTWDRPASA